MRHFLSFLALLLMLVGCAQSHDKQSSNHQELAAGTRHVARSAKVVLEHQNPDAVGKRVEALATRLGGHLLSSETTQEHADSERLDTHFVVPTNRLADAVGELEGWGQVLSSSRAEEDRTEEVVDLTARLKQRRTLEARLLKLVDGAKHLEEVLILEKELARVRSDIEAGEAKERMLQEKTSMASIELAVVAPDAPAFSSEAPLGAQLRRALVGSSKFLVFVLRGLMVVLTALIPFMALGAIAAAPIVYIRRRRREAATA